MVSQHKYLACKTVSHLKLMVKGKRLTMNTLHSHTFFNVQRFSRQCLTLCVVAVLSMTGTALSAFVIDNNAIAQAMASYKQTRKVPALRGKVYEQLARAQSLADANQPQAAFSILQEVESKKASMNSYEVAMLHNFYGFIYYNLEQADKALEAFQQVIAQDGIPESFEQSTLFTLAQLSMMQGLYIDAIAYLDRWEGLNVGKIPAKHWFIKAQAYYQDKQFEQAGQSVTQAVQSQEAQGMIPDEGWLILQRAILYELKQPEKVKDVLIKMVKLFNAPKYWIQLGGMYGELGLEKQQLAVMEAAKQQGFLTKASDIFNLAQLYYYHKAPYKCAQIMQQAMDDGVLNEDLRNLKFLGQCYQVAKDNDKAVPVMIAAAELASDGEIYAQLSQLVLNLDDFNAAIKFANLALEKGGLRNQGTMHLVLGMAYYNQREFAQSMDQLAQAQTFTSTQKMAKQWLQFVEKEQAVTFVSQGDFVLNGA